jgi:uncharacterized protein (TIGR00255 family)
MAVYSMTGYATATSEPAETSPDERSTERNPERHQERAAQAVTVDVRSVNGRFLDLSLRLPDEMRGLEPALRELVSAAVRRGKVELRISTAREAAGEWPQPTPEQVNRLMRLESSVQSWLPQARPLSVNEVLQWCRGAGAAPKLDEATLDAAKRAVQGLREARAREGARLVEVLMERLNRLRELAAAAAPLVPEVVRKQQQRFLERWTEALATAGAASQVPAASLQERALNEAAAFAIRVDVAEELARLKSHLDEIERLLKAGGELGKRLDFLIQELQREANTLGSKSAALELTNIAVEMKVAVEQMREQVQNLE